MKGIEDKVPEEILKDSEVQPPNPVPPESHSNEKAPDPAENKLKQIAPEQQDVKDQPNAVPEIHPKDLRMKIEEAKLINGDQDKVQANNIEKPEEGKEKSPKPESSQEKLDIMKKQQLIETIKQHGEEQKELIKEQKEILHEILKTKKELEKDKKDIDETAAKKIAVESIQKIANMAIQSLSGVTDKPVEEVNARVRNAEPLQKIANDAVQEIAKKAAETLEAIGEKKEPMDTLPKPVDQTDGNKKPQIEVKGEILPPNISNSIKSNNTLDPVPQSVQQNEKENVDSNNHSAGQLKDIPKNAINETLAHNIINEVSNPLKLAKDQLSINKEHSHSLDEPQSYKHGEDLVKKAAPNFVNNNIIPNVPLPIKLKGSQENPALNGVVQDNGQNLSLDSVKTNSNNQQNVPAKVLSTVIKSNNHISDRQVEYNENIKEEERNNPLNAERAVPEIRQKREVVDCTEKTTLKPEDRQICENLISNHNLPSDVKLNIGLPLNLPMHSNIIQRSLKSYNEDRRR